MSEKWLFFLLNFIGVGMIVIGGFVSIPLLILGLVAVVVNAVNMAIYCNVVFK